MRANQLSQRVNDELRRKGQRCSDGAGRERAVIRSVGYTSSFVHPENSINFIDAFGRGSGAVAGAYAPTERSIPCEFLRILFGITAVHVRGAAAVLEIVESLVLHEPIDNSAQIEPAVAELVDKERPHVKVFDSVMLSPVERFLPSAVALRRQREGGRAKCQHVHQQRSVVPLVPITDEAGLWRASVDYRDVFDAHSRPVVLIARNGVQGPLPVGASIKGVGGFANFTLNRRVRVKERSSQQHTRQQKRAIHCRKLAASGATTSLHFQEMIIEPLVPSRVGLGPLRAVLKESQGGENAFGSVRACYPAIVHGNRITTQSQTRGRNAAWRIFASVVSHKPVPSICVIQKIAEGQLLKFEDIVRQLGNASE